MKKSICQVAQDVLRDAMKPMSVKEIYLEISEKNLYQFKAKNPEGVLRSQLRRHTKNIDLVNQAGDQVFVLHDDGRFGIA